MVAAKKKEKRLERERVYGKFTFEWDSHMCNEKNAAAHYNVLKWNME